MLTLTIMLTLRLHFLHFLAFLLHFLSLYIFFVLSRPWPKFNPYVELHSRYTLNAFFGCVHGAIFFYLSSSITFLGAREWDTVQAVLGDTLGSVLALPVITGKALTLSVPQCAHLKNGLKYMRDLCGALRSRAYLNPWCFHT